MSSPSQFVFVIAIYPNTRGIAFVVFEGPNSLIDWGTRGARHSRNPMRILEAVTSLFESYWPAILVIQDGSVFESRRSERLRTLNDAVAELAETRGVPIRSHSRAEVRDEFAHIGAHTKAAIADAISTRIPALGYHLPPPRKPWMSEHARMGVFDAAALALTFFAQAGRNLGGANGDLMSL